MKNQMKGKKGITLIALVITIIVLLILAGVTIATLTGDNGLLTKASDAKKSNEEATAREKIQVEVAGSYGVDGNIDKDQLNINLRKIEGLKYNEKPLSDTNKINELSAKIELSGYSYIISEKGSVVREKRIEEYPEITANVKAEENSRYISNGKTAVVPKGYTVSNVEEEKNIDTGLVIKKDGNEWVWIPVNDDVFTKMFGIATDDGWNLSGTSVKTKYKSKGSIISLLYRGNPGTTGWSEPDVLSDESQDISIAGLGKNITEMATALRDDYKAMVESINKYKGFYIGRYELSESGEQKDKEPIVKKSWYEIYAKCKTLGSDSTVSAMIYGCQWDQTCNFIKTAKDAEGKTIDLRDSKKYGNYSNSQAPANTNNGNVKNTGSNEAWKTNNIYDLAGNCWEWTQDAGSTVRAVRGGAAGNDGVNCNVCRINDWGKPAESSRGGLSSRAILYVK